MGLKIGGLVADQGIGRGVRLVEAVAGELGHEVEDILGLFFVHLIGQGAGHEFVLFRRHHLGDFLAHGAAQHVGIAQRIAGQDGSDFHDLLLVDDDPVGLLQDRFELRQRIAGRLFTVLGVDEVLHHA